MKKSLLLIATSWLFTGVLAQTESQHYNNYYLHDKPTSMMIYNYEMDGTTTTDWFNHVFTYDAQGNMVQDEATLTYASGGAQKERNLFEYNASRQITKASAQEYSFFNSQYKNQYVEEWKYDAYGIDSAYTEYSWFVNPPIIAGGDKQKMTRDASGKILEVSYYEWNSFDENFRLEEKRIFKYNSVSNKIDSVITWTYNGTLDKLQLSNKWYDLAFKTYDDIDFTNILFTSYTDMDIIFGGTDRHEITYNSNGDKLIEEIFHNTDSDPSLVYTWTYSTSSVTEITQYWSGTELVNYEKLVTLLDEKGFYTGEEKYDWDGSSLAWTLDRKSRTLRTFTSGKCTQEILQTWDYTNAAWINNEKRVYTYTNNPTAILSPGFQPNVQLYPNPAVETVQLSDLKEVISAEVISSTGISYKAEDLQQIEIKGASGLYLVKVRFTGDRYYTYKVIKQ